MRKTPWKKSRTYGDNYGGASRRRDADDLRIRYHSLSEPSPFDTLPIFRVDNPSRSWFHPLNEDQVRYALERLPQEDHGDVTHVWLRRASSHRQIDGHWPSTSIYGRGVALVTLYPMPQSLEQNLGGQKPQPSCQRLYRKYGVVLQKIKGMWRAKWTLSEVRKYYLHNALFDAVSYHSAYVWRDGSSNLVKTRNERMEDWLRRREGISTQVYQELFG